MNNKVYFLAILLLSLSVSCSSFRRSETASAQNEEIVFDDGYKTTADGDIIIDDKSFEDKTGLIMTAGQSTRGVTQTAKDGSQINVTYDSFGNKTETRTFDNNPFLKLVLLRTDVDGNKQVFVYGRTGAVKGLPENMVGKILTASATDLANSAGIYEAYYEQPASTQNTPPNMTALQPLPSSHFPVRNLPVEPVATEEVEPPTAETEKTVPTDKSELPEKKEKIASTVKPGDQ